MGLDDKSTVIAVCRACYRRRASVFYSHRVQLLKSHHSSFISRLDTNSTADSKTAETTAKEATTDKNDGSAPTNDQDSKASDANAKSAS